jgi:multidrug efflux pump
VANDSYANLGRVVQQFQAEMAKNPGFVQPDTDLRSTSPNSSWRWTASARRTWASASTRWRAVETMLGGRNVTRYKRDAEQYDVIVQLEAGGRSTPEQTSRSSSCAAAATPWCRWPALVKVRETVSPRELNHFNQRRSVTISANLAPGFALGEALPSSWTASRQARCCHRATPPSSTA